MASDTRHELRYVFDPVKATRSRSLRHRGTDGRHGRRSRRGLLIDAGLLIDEGRRIISRHSTPSGWAWAWLKGWHPMNDAKPADDGGPLYRTIARLIAQHAALARLLAAKGVYTAAEYNHHVERMLSEVELAAARLIQSAPPPAEPAAPVTARAKPRRRRKPAS